MSLDGVWTGEIYGPYGWESSGVYVLDHGLVLGGNSRHYATGKYDLSGNNYNARINVHYYGPPRAIFGEKREEFQIEVKGEVDEGTIVAEVVRPDRPEFVVDYRMTRRIDIPDA